MENRKIENKTLTIRWIKRITVVVATAVWVAVLYSIFRNGGEFGDQTPQCMFATMAIFGVLTGIFKGLEYWQSRD